MTDGKKVTSVNLDKDLADHFSNDPGKNLSGTVNKLLRQYIGGDTGERSMLELRETQLQSDIQSLETTLETKRNELADVQERLAELDAQEEQLVDDFAANVTFKKGLSSMGNPWQPAHDRETLEMWADKAGVTVEELVERARDIKDKHNQ